MSYKNTQAEEKVKLAGDDSKDRLYEPKQNQKLIRILTVVAYIFCVSLAAIMLSLYYIYIWDPATPHCNHHRKFADHITQSPKCSEDQDEQT